jgi:hypothetical protein
MESVTLKIRKEAEVVSCFWFFVSGCLTGQNLGLIKKPSRKAKFLTQEKNQKLQTKNPKQRKQGFINISGFFY